MRRSASNFAHEVLPIRTRGPHVVKLAGLLIGSAVAAHLCGLAVAHWYRSAISSATTQNQNLAPPPVETETAFDFGEV